MAATQHPGDQHEIPGYEAHVSAASLKDRIKQHYEIASDYYYSLWGQHIHHGLFRDPRESKEEAQVNLIRYLLEISRLPRASRVLDVGCGLGGTSRFLAREHGCAVTGITISGRQVDIAKRLTLEDKAGLVPAAPTPLSGQEGEDKGEGEADASKSSSSPSLDHWLSYSTDGDGDGDTKKDASNGDAGVGAGAGSVRFLELDAEKMMERFGSSSPTAGSDKKKGDGYRDGSSRFDCVWISEALSHLPNKPLFFSSSFAVLAAGSSSRLVVADWFKAPDLTPEQVAEDIKPIEDGMLLPRLYTADEYVRMAEEAGFATLQAPIDISAEVAKTW
ncbi:hypothetical protein SLS62_000286 [Diatrype stigma]|uniref:Uncharacterized protein n=1 Tax=Diatrype stigma TaxID=117547 RepID=A0AAN9YSZ1_9PEZI